MPRHIGDAGLAPTKGEAPYSKPNNEKYTMGQKHQKSIHRGRPIGVRGVGGGGQ